MSEQILPQVYPKVSNDDIERDARASWEEACERAERLREERRDGHHRLSEEGTRLAMLVVHGAGDVLREPALENHDYNHRLFRDFRCSSRCRASDLGATLWLNVKMVGPSKDWPIRQVLARVVEKATGYRIKDPADFVRHFARDLRRLPAANATPRRQRTAAQRRLVATYNATRELSLIAKQSVASGAAYIEKK